MPIGDLIDKFTSKFTETVFYKKESELQYQIDAIKNLLVKYPNNEVLMKKLKLCELGLQGEREIEFELKNANIGMYVLHDINLEYKDLKAQIDYVLFTPSKMYLIECKNLIGNITIDNKGNFIREYQYGNKKIREGIYSPVTQAQRHLEVLKKIWMETHTGILDKTVRLKNFEVWRKPLVVLSNSKSVLNDRYAPKQVKDMVIKSDRLVDYIKNDIAKTDKDLLASEKEMHKDAYTLMRDYNEDVDRDYYKEYEELVKKDYAINKGRIIEDQEEYIAEPDRHKLLEIRNRMLEYRKIKSREKNIPAYYIFNNEELDRILVLMPKTKQELIESKILTEVKLKLHGEEIINILNS